MEVIIFVRRLNATEYHKLGKRKFDVLPRQDEYISAEWEGEKRFFQVTGVHHRLEEGGLEVYAVQSEPSWMAKKSRAIGFGH